MIFLNCSTPDHLTLYVCIGGDLDAASKTLVGIRLGKHEEVEFLIAVSTSILLSIPSLNICFLGSPLHW